MIVQQHLERVPTYLDSCFNGLNQMFAAQAKDPLTLNPLCLELTLKLFATHHRTLSAEDFTNKLKEKIFADKERGRLLQILSNIVKHG